MTVPEPLHCRPDAYDCFLQHLPNVETATGLLGAAVAISMHELSDARPQAIEHRIGLLSDRVKNRVRGDNKEALIAHLHQVLFDEEDFSGNRDNYYNARNSYVPVVLESKRGIPITLTLIYKCVAERLGLTVHGINAPGHFLATVEMEGTWTLVDPFFNGQILSHDEALERIEKMIGRRLPATEAEQQRPDTNEVPMTPMFQPATHRDWLARMIRNLCAVFEQEGGEDDLAAMTELFRLLQRSGV